MAKHARKLVEHNKVRFDHALTAAAACRRFRLPTDYTSIGAPCLHIPPPPGGDAPTRQSPLAAPQHKQPFSTYCTLPSSSPHPRLLHLLSSLLRTLPSPCSPRSHRLPHLLPVSSLVT